MAVPPKANSLAHRHIKNALSAKREKPHIYAAIRVVAPETLRPPSLPNRSPGLPKTPNCIARMHPAAARVEHRTAPVLPLYFGAAAS